MNNYLLSLIVAAGCVISATAKHDTLNPVMQELELNADTLLYLNNENMEKVVLSTLDDLKKMGEGSSMADAMETVIEAVEWSGLLSSTAYGMSLSPDDDGLSRQITALQLNGDSAKTPFGRLMLQTPRALKGVNFVPETSVYAVNGLGSLSETWKIVNEGVEKFGNESTVAGLAQGVMMTEMMLGTNVTALIDSIEGEYLVSIQLAEEDKIVIPVDATTNLSIPEPDLLIALETKSSLLADIIIQQLKAAQMPVEEEIVDDSTVYTLTLPISSPVTLSPSMVMKDGYLVITSSKPALLEALKCFNGKDGLVESDFYKTMLEGMPEAVCAIELVTPRFMSAYVDIMTSLMGEESPEMNELFDRLFANYQQMSSGIYTLTKPMGLVSKGRVDMNGKTVQEMFISTYVNALGTAMVVPLMMAEQTFDSTTSGSSPFTTNKQRAMESEAIAGLGVVSAAGRIYLVGNGSAPTAFKDLISESYLTRDDLNGTYYSADSGYDAVIFDKNSGRVKSATLTDIDGAVKTFTLNEQSNTYLVEQQ